MLERYLLTWINQVIQFPCYSIIAKCAETLLVIISNAIDKNKEKKSIGTKEGRKIKNHLLTFSSDLFYQDAVEKH